MMDDGPCVRIVKQRHRLSHQRKRNGNGINALIHHSYPATTLGIRARRCVNSSFGFALAPLGIYDFRKRFNAERRILAHFVQMAGLFALPLTRGLA